MKKICITERTVLNENLLKKEFEIIDNPYEADFIIAQSTVRFPELISKTIYLTGEAPLAEHRVWCYTHFDYFYAVFCFNPEERKNQFPMNHTGEYQFYPSRPDPFEFFTREDTNLRNRGVFYAGMVGFYEDMPDSCGGINITPLRRLLGEYFLKEFPDSIIIGRGWRNQTTKVEKWRIDKHTQIMESKCDFVLALENTIYPNYLYEKIWDGFATDRVTLYLGDPNIEKHIPLNCFIDLRPYFNLETKEFDLESLGKRLKEMTQEEYDEIIKNARTFRETCKGRFRYNMDLTTNKVIEVIKNGI